MTLYVTSPNFHVLSVIINFLLAKNHRENILKRTIASSAIASSSIKLWLCNIEGCNQVVAVHTVLTVLCYSSKNKVSIFCNELSFIIASVHIENLSPTCC